MPGMGHNGAARAGQANFTYTASVEWAHAGVRVNAVLPGFIASSGLDRYPERAHDALRNVRTQIPMKRHGTESEIAGAIVYLLSEAAAYVTGIALRVDGGLHNMGKSSFYEVPEQTARNRSTASLSTAQGADNTRRQTDIPGNLRPTSRRQTTRRVLSPSQEQENKEIVGRWFTEFWGNPWNPRVIDELAAPDMLLQYSLHEPRRGRDDVRDFMTGFRAAFPDLAFGGAADLIAEGDYVVGRWIGGGTHTGPAFDDFLIGALPAASGRKMRFTGTTVIRVADGRIAEEVGLDDGVTALTQLGLLRTA
jgi:predicted ester cyclase